MDPNKEIVVEEDEEEYEENNSTDNEYEANKWCQPVVRCIWKTLKDGKTLRTKIEERWNTMEYKNFITFDQFKKEIKHDTWFGSGALFESAAASLFLLFCSVPSNEVYTSSSIELLKSGVMTQSDFVNCGGLIFYFIYTSKIRDANSDGLLEWDEFKLIYPSIDRILNCNSSSMASVQSNFSKWFFNTIAEPNDEIPVDRFMEVTYGLCHLASMIFALDPLKNGSITLDQFKQEFLAKSFPMDSYSKILKLLEEKTNAKLNEKLSYEVCFKYLLMLDVMQPSRRKFESNVNSPK